MSPLSNRVKEIDIVAGDHVYSWRALFSYAHHGIYVGDGVVINFTAPPGKLTDSIDDHFASGSIPGVSSSSSTRGAKTCPNCHPRCGKKSEGGVIVSCLNCFKDKGSLYRYEYGVSKTALQWHIRGGTCTTAESDPASEVIHRANYLFENGGFGNYNLIKNNCEDFARYCKTGLLVMDEEALGRSGQIADLVRVKIFTKKMKAKFFSNTEESEKKCRRKHGMGRYAADIGVRRDVKKVPVEDLDNFHRRLVAATYSTQGGENDLQVDENDPQDDDNSTQDDENDLQDDDNDLQDDDNST
ncbi:protein LEAD-SENSITIVE 1-like [Rhododendron vialii]|uniref:protein LEAD-SENSITIVE 1-like n=1 Tax=Rhododendron vialii TaxID=182163 RepID=UPI00265F221B|nr:protein LEAD-SENSITIVE 1-like [Rhododendron vialii]